MPLEQLFKDAAGLIRRHRSLWTIGLVATAGGLLGNLVLRSMAWYGASRLSTGDVDAEALLDQLIQPAKLGAGLASIFLFGVLAWLVSAVAEGGLIEVVAGRANDETISLGRAVRMGAGLLGRFMGIDTLLFLPLFLLTLALMLIGFAVLGGIVVAATRPAAEPTDIAIAIGLGSAAAIPVLLSMLVVSIGALTVRPLAFRAAAMEGLGTSFCIRRGWSVLRQRTLSVLVLALVLTALRSMTGMPLRIATVGVTGASLWQIIMAATGSGPAPGGIALLVTLTGVGLAFLSWLVSGIMNAYGSTTWTLSYEIWIEELQ